MVSRTERVLRERSGPGSRHYGYRLTHSKKERTSHHDLVALDTELLENPHAMFKKRLARQRMSRGEPLTFEDHLGKLTRPHWLARMKEDTEEAFRLYQDLCVFRTAQRLMQNKQWTRTVKIQGSLASRVYEKLGPNDRLTRRFVEDQLHRTSGELLDILLKHQSTKK